MIVRQQQVLKAAQCCERMVERRMVGKVSHKERDEILALFERKNGLNELIRSLVEADDEVLTNHHFYEKIVADMGKTVTKFQQWWDGKAKQYQWENIKGHVWEIDFDTCRIYLKKQ
jgi:CXXX repeat modification system protein